MTLIERPFIQKNNQQGAKFMKWKISEKLVLIYPLGMRSSPIIIKSDIIIVTTKNKLIEYYVNWWTTDNGKWRHIAVFESLEWMTSSVT